MRPAAGVVPSLDAIAADPTQAGRLTPAVRAAALTRCAAVLAALAAPTMATPDAIAPVAEPDRLLDVRETAQRLNVSADYVYRHSAEWPFTVRHGRKLGFSAHGLTAYLSRRAGDPLLTGVS